MRRTLSETLFDLSESLLRVQQAFDAVRLEHVSLNLPVEVMLVRREGEFVFLADIPCWRWRTPFDQRPGRMILKYGAREET